MYDDNHFKEINNNNILPIFITKQHKTLIILIHFVLHHKNTHQVKL